MLGQINEWFFHDLAGIQSDPARPGFKKIIIKPAIVGDLTGVKGKYDSVRGPIATEWKRNVKAFTLILEIPPGTTATVFVPAQSPDEVFESDSAATKSREVKFLRLENGSAVFEIASGKYQFTVSSRRP
jgi:hypothetical protein